MCTVIIGLVAIGMSTVIIVELQKLKLLNIASLVFLMLPICFFLYLFIYLLGGEK